MVWDNSADGGCSASAIRQFFPDGSKVWVEVSDCNLGFAAGVNRAIKRIRQERPADWILVINNDATLRVGAIERLVGAMQANPAALMVVPAINHSGSKKGQMYYQRWSGLLSYSSRFGGFAFPSGCCFLLNPERCHCSLYDERFFMYGEDLELGVRFAREGEIVFLTDVLVDHEGSASSRLGSRFYEERVVAAHFLIVKSLARTPIIRLGLLLTRSPFLLARALLRTFRFRSLLPLRALYWGWQIARGRDPLRQAAADANRQPGSSRRIP